MLQYPILESAYVALPQTTNVPLSACTKLMPWYRRRLPISVLGARRIFFQGGALIFLKNVDDLFYFFFSFRPLLNTQVLLFFLKKADNLS